MVEHEILHRSVGGVMNEVLNITINLLALCTLSAVVLSVVFMTLRALELFFAHE